MPGKVGVKIKAGRNLPVMDRSSETTDAYVEIKLGSVTHKTDVCRKSLNPQWNTDWFRFEVDDADLQDEPLQIRLMDYDTYSANDAIGKVNISLNPLCLEIGGQINQGKGAVLSGWIPVFDTMHGIRGEVYITVKVDLFSDANKFRQSSCGIQFFHSPCVPHGYRAQIIHGFVEELVVNDDPEYQWIDKIRTPRASNEARQVVFLRLSGQVQRKIGLKAINLGANSVIGYTQCFDLEGDVGVVARGIGTAVTLVKLQEASLQPVTDNALIEERTLKYLEFLKGNGSVDECSKSIFDYDAFNDTDNSCDLVYKILGLDDPFSTKTPNIILKPKWKPTNKNSAIPEEDSENEGIRMLMDQENQRGEKPRRRFKHHMKRIKTSSRNLLNEKFSAFKSKPQDESKSPHSSLSDLSFSGSARSSLTEFGNLLKFRKRKTVVKQKMTPINRSNSDGSGMATVLVSSIMHGPSLDSISEKDSPFGTLVNLKKVKNRSKSGSMTNLARESKEESVSPKSFQAHVKSESMIELAKSKWLKPDINAMNSPTLSMSSVASTTTTIDEQSSDDESDEDDDTSPSEIVVVDPDTVSMVVKSVLAQESASKDSEYWIHPGTAEEDAGLILGATRILKSDKHSKIMESEIHESVENDCSEIKKILQARSFDENEENNWIEPGSTIDQPEFTDKERRGSLLHNIKEQFHHLQEHMHLPHFSDQKTQPKHTMLETAMETILMDKAHFMGAEEDSNVEVTPSKSQKRRGSLDAISKILHLPFGHHHHDDDQDHDKSKHSEITNDSGMLANAMRTIAMEPFQLSDDIVDFEKCNQFYEKHEPHETEQTSEPALENKCQAGIKTNAEDYEDADKLAEQRQDNSMSNVSNKIFKGLDLPALTVTNLKKSCNTNNTQYITYYSSNPEFATKSTNSLNSVYTSLTNLNSAAYSASRNAPFPVLKISPPTPTPSTTDTEESLSPNQSIRCLLQPPFISLSCNQSSTNTNNAALLAPSTPLCPKHHRSSTELVSTASEGGSSIGITSSPGKSIQQISSAVITPPITGHIRAESLSMKISQSPKATGGGNSNNNSFTNKETVNGVHRRSSDSDLSITPKGNSLCVASERLVQATAMMRINQPSNIKPVNTADSLDMLEYPFLTMAKYPPGFILNLGSTVAARSVKLLERVPNPDEPETRDSWWTELRMEIRSHARTLGCNVILGYSEETTISEDVCVLSATGTAAVINMSYNAESSQVDLSMPGKMIYSLDEKEILKETRNSGDFVVSAAPRDLSSSFTAPSKTLTANGTTSSGQHPTSSNRGCLLCHIPYSYTSVPFPCKMKKCAVCKKGRVPDVMLATIELPESLSITGRGCFMQAQVLRTKKDLRSESNAKEISDGLPFLEYELHRLLINKLKAKGMNAIFGLKAQVTIGERMMALIATGTAVFLTSLPSPTVPKIVAGNSWTDKVRLNELQKCLQETFERNREIYQLKNVDPDFQNGKQSDTDDSDDEVLEMDLNAGNKDTCVLEVDDIEDLEIISLLMEACPPEGFHIVNTQSVPGLQDLEVVRNLQMFTQVWRAKLAVGQNTGGFPKHFQRLLQTIYFKLRSMIPCAICDLRFRLDLPESDEIQVLVTGMALGLGEPTKSLKTRRKTISNNSDSGSSTTNGSQTKKPQEDELMFNLDEDQNMEINASSNTLQSVNYGSHSLRLRKNSPCRTRFSSMRLSRHLPLRERYGVDITPLSYVPGGKIEKYLGNLNFFFIRETTSIREIGGISGFVHSFVTELLAVVRANIAALGGNAMVSYYMTELILVDNQHKNQGQCLISIGGDVVNVSYFSDD